jgi:ATP synthase protein I
VVAIDLSQVRRLAFGLVRAQAVVTVVVAVVSFALAGRHAAISALLGGGISTLASLAMALVAFGKFASGDALRLVGAFYAGEVIKLAVVIALFVIVLRLMNVSPGAMFTAYGATFLVYWIALIRGVVAGALPKPEMV